MSGYFKNFKKTRYSLSESANNYQIVTNIFQRSNFLRNIVDNTANFYDYLAKDGDTPEIIADKLYGDSSRHWIVLLYNQVINPYYIFPLSPEALNTYITNKYQQTLEESQTTVHHYELEITRVRSVTYYNDGISDWNTVSDENVETQIISEYEADYTTGKLTKRSLPGIDQSLTFIPETVTVQENPKITLTETKKITSVSNYTYELLENEKRRNIKLLDKKYIPQIELEFKKMMQ